MPSGKIHTRIDLFLLVVLIGAAGYFWSLLTGYFGRDEFVEYGSVFVVAYLFGTFLLSPDMDLNTSDPMRNWGVLRLLWRPYAHFFKHRGVSHVPILGTLTRVVYILLLVYVIFAVANALFDLGWELSVKNLRGVDQKAIIWGLCGLCLPDIFHIMADRLFKNAR
ncbi:MAG: putative metal-binding protein [Candidatus Latescibacterota bacterium]|jgi:uncharacterized metal-binding protein